jgi:uridine kinase
MTDAVPAADELPRDHEARLLAWSDRVEVPAGTVFLREGDPSGDLYLVLAGTFRLRRGHLDLKTIGPGDHFGAIAMLTGLPRTASVTAATDARVARITPEAWGAFAARDPSAALRVLQWLLAGIRDDLTGMTDSVGLLLQGRSLPRSREVEVTVGGDTRRVATGTQLATLLPVEVDGAPVVAGLFGQYPVSLATPVLAPGRVAPLTTAHWEGRQIYARSVGLLLLEAAARVLPDAVVRMGPSRGRHQEVDLPPEVDGAAAARDLAAEMRRMVASDLPIRTELWTLEEAA